MEHGDDALDVDCFAFWALGWRRATAVPTSTSTSVSASTASGSHTPSTSGGPHDRQATLTDLVALAKELQHAGHAGDEAAVAALLHRLEPIPMTAEILEATGEPGSTARVSSSLPWV
jgi:hypothetical protein